MGIIIRTRSKYNNSKIIERFGRIDSIFAYELVSASWIFVILNYFILLEEGVRTELILRTPLYVIGKDRDIIGLLKIVTE